MRKARERRVIEILGLTLLLMTAVSLPAEAQKCSDSQVIYLMTGNPPTTLAPVGCRMSGQTPDCSTLPGPPHKPYPSSGSCSLCLQEGPFQHYDDQSAPADLIQRGAWGFFRQLGKGGSPYPVDFGCLDGGWGCVSGIWEPYSCKGCVSLPYERLVWNLGAWTFDGQFKDHAFGATPISKKKPGFTAGVRNGAVSFSRADQYLEFKDQDVGFDWIADGDFSVEGWIRTKSKKTQVILSKRTGPSTTQTPVGGQFPNVIGDLHFRIDLRDVNCTCATGLFCGFQVIISGGRLGIQMADGRHYNFLPPSSSPQIADGDWHHFAVTVDRQASAGIKFYVDGAEVGTEDPTRRPGCLSNDASLFIGGQSSDSGFGFIGELDELTFWADVPDPTEIEAIYRADNSGHCLNR